MEIEIGVSIFILFALLLLSTIDMAFSQLSDVSLRRISSDAEDENKKKSARFLHEILDNRSHFRFALSAAIQVLLVVFTVFCALLVYRFYPTSRDILIYALLGSLTLTILFRQILPRFIVGSNPEKRLLALLPIMRPLYRLWSFVALPFSNSLHNKERQKLESTIVPNETDEAVDSDDLNVLIQVGEAEGIIEQEERELIKRMIEFTDTEVDEIMTPRTEIVALPIDSTVKDARDLIIDKKYSRMPVFRDNIDNIEGFIYVRDLMNNWDEGKENELIEPLLRPAYFVPETKSAAELLKIMQLDHVQVAIVIDEYGGVAGLVTLEDIVEEIVGEIEDEDILEEEIVEIIEGTEGYWDVLGSTEIGKIERVIEMEISDDDYTTIAGFVTTEVGSVPKTGDKLNFRGLDVEILQADEKKVHLLRIKKSVPKVGEIEEI